MTALNIIQTLSTDQRLRALETGLPELETRIVSQVQEVINKSYTDLQAGLDASDDALRVRLNDVFRRLDLLERGRGLVQLESQVPEGNRDRYHAIVARRDIAIQAAANSAEVMQAFLVAAEAQAALFDKAPVRPTHRVISERQLFWRSVGGCLLGAAGGVGGTLLTQHVRRGKKEE